MYIASYSILRN